MSAIDFGEQTPDVATPSGLSKRSIYALAENVANQVEYTPGGDLRKSIARIGGTIQVHEYSLSPDSNEESLIVYAPSKFTIFISPDSSEERDNFTIAHELGHYVVHFLWKRHKGENIKSMVANRFGSTRVEWEANWFAAAFLMPAKQFQEFWQQVDSLVRVAEHFGVSRSAAEIRAKSLGLVD